MSCMTPSESQNGGICAKAVHVETIVHRVIYVSKDEE